MPLGSLPLSLGMFHLWNLSTGSWAYLMLCMLHATPTYIPHGWLFVPALEGNECEPLQIASEHAQRASSTLWDWEKVYKLEHSTPSYRKQKRTCQYSPWLCRIKRRHTILRTPTPQPRGNKKCGAGVSKKGLREPQNLQQAW